MVLPNRYLKEVLFYLLVPAVAILLQYLILVAAFLVSFGGSLLNPLSKVNQTISLMTFLAGNLILVTILFALARFKRFDSWHRTIGFVLIVWIISLLVFWLGIVKVL